MAKMLEGKVAVITGGCDGIGRGGVSRFVDEGANVVVADIQVQKGRQLERELGAAVRFIECDIRNEEAMTAAIDLAVSEFGGLDVMYHNAATPGANAPIDELHTNEWNDSVGMLLTPSLWAIKHSVPVMRERGGGSIILTSSAAAYNLKRKTPPSYPILKGAVVNLVETAALRYASDRIRVNAIVPGGVASAIHLKKYNFSQELADAVWPHFKELLFSRYQPIPERGNRIH